MGETTAQQRETWKAFECNPDAMTIIDFGPARIRVAPPTVDAFHALASVLLFHGYEIRVGDTDSYNCRAIKGGIGKSLHSYGIAVDVDWDTNPFKETPNKRAVKFSDKATQEDRAQDVKLGIADTDMTQAMIDDVLAIKTNNKKTAFRWGGDWNDRKDAMHFEMDVTPADLETGIDWSTVKQLRPAKAVEGTVAAVKAVDDAGNAAPQGTSQLATGARGDAVRTLQQNLATRGLPVGTIDGIYGSQTEAAVRAFQAAQGLRQTGIADTATLQAVGAPLQQQTGGTAMNPENVLRAIFGALLGSPPGSPAALTANQPQATATVQDIALLVLNALMANQSVAVPGAKPPAAAAPPVAGTSPAAPVLSAIDQWLGGSALAGKKTALATVAYAVLSILQAVGAAGTATGPSSTATGQILTTLIGGFGALGLTAKIDRVVQTLGLIAAKPPASSQ
jgi:hypothetical protein